MTERRARRRATVQGGRLHSGRRGQAPNEVWTVDFKGWWYDEGKRRCEPLTVRDEHTRYVLELRRLKDARSDTVRRAFEQLFIRYGLPQAICGTNSFWARGYGDPPPETLIVLGFSREYLERHFESCELAGHVTNRFSIANEEAKQHSDIFVCRRLRGTWPEFWKTFRRYG